MSLMRTHEISVVRGDLDTPLPLASLSWLSRALDTEALPLVVHLPANGTWSSWPVYPRELPLLIEGIAEAWVVRRPGCDGIVTRVLLLDAEGTVLAALAADCAAGEREPAAWQLLLLLALLAR